MPEPPRRLRRLPVEMLPSGVTQGSTVLASLSPGSDPAADDGVPSGGKPAATGLKGMSMFSPNDFTDAWGDPTGLGEAEPWGTNIQVPSAVSSFVGMLVL